MASTFRRLNVVGSVRVGSGPPPFTFNPSQLGSKLTLWIDEREQSAIGSNVVSWGDQSSNGSRDFLAPPGQSYLGGQVGYNINGYAAPHFVRAVPFFGSPSEMNSYTWYLSDIITPTAYHAYAVVNIANVVTDYVPGGQNEGFCSIIGPGGAWWPFTFKANGGSPQLTSGHYASGWKTVYSSGLTLNTNLLLETWYDGTNIYACIANGSTGSLAAGAMDGNLSILQMRIGTGGMSGSVGTFLACNQVLDNTERANVRQYLGTKYGVAY